MNSNIKDLILSECWEDNALAIEILKRKRFVLNSRIPNMIEKVLRKDYFIHKDKVRYSNNYRRYWSINRFYPMGPETIFNYDVYD